MAPLFGARRDWSYFRRVFDNNALRKLTVAMTGSVLVSFVETGSILLLLPLMTLLGGGSDAGGLVNLIARVAGNPPRDTLIFILLAMVLAGFVLKDVFTITFRWWVLGFLARQQVFTSRRMFAYLLRSPYAQHMQRTMAEMLRVVGDAVSQYFNRIVGGTMAVIAEGVTIATIVGAMLIIMPLQTIMVCAYFAVAAGIFNRVIKPSAIAAGRVQLESGRMAAEWLIWGFGGIQEIQIRHAHDHYVAGFKQWADQGALAGRTATFLSELPKYLLEVLFILGLGILIVGVIIGGGSGSLFGTLAVLAAAAFRVLPSLTRLLASITTIRSGEGARDLLYQELDREHDYGIEYAARTDPRLPFAHSIELHEVEFTYEDGVKPVLRCVDMSIPAGSSVAVVGGSGAGKTTLANLLLGLYQPTGGTISVDDVDIARHLAAWQDNVAVVPQDVWLMDSTLAENIAFDESPHEIDRDRLASAIEQAQLNDLVDNVFGGVDARFGERGSRLSGGQKQRIGIARALYRNPSFLLLDEATSALDNETERRITDTIARLHGRITIVVIAHRLSTVRNLDSVVLLKDGLIEDQGTFAELVGRNAGFAHLVELGRLDAQEAPDADAPHE
jgi:ATP-binding cassette, subfamily B, bacterial PglK